MSATQNTNCRDHICPLSFLFNLEQKLSPRITTLSLCINLRYSHFYYNPIQRMVDHHFLHRFCHIGKVIDCNEVLKSKGASIAGIGIGELSWMYFTTMFFFTAVCPEEFHFWLPCLFS